MAYKHGGLYWYHIRWKVTEPDGTLKDYDIRQSTHQRTKNEANKVENEHRRALAQGIIHPLERWPKPKQPRTVTLREYSDSFLEHVRLHTKPRTARFYDDCLRRVLAFSPLADRPMCEVNSEFIDKYIAWRQAQRSGNTLVSINTELRTLRRAFNLAAERAVIDKAPVIHVLYGEEGRDRVITHAEEARYLAEAPPTLYCMAILAVDTGLRPNSELFPLEWANVHLDPTPGTPNGFMHVPHGKTKNAVRNVPLTPRAKAVLVMRKPAKGGSRYVFPGPGNSGHITTVQHTHERAIRRANEEARRQGLEKAEFEPFEFYCWRHTFGTRCAESGMSKFALAGLMGHSSPSVAERYYVKVTQQHVAEGFEHFMEYQSKRIVESIPMVTEKVQ